MGILIFPLMSLINFLLLALRPRDTAEENASWRKPSTGYIKFSLPLFVCVCTVNFVLSA